MASNHVLTALNIYFDVVISSNLFSFVLTLPNWKSPCLAAASAVLVFPAAVLPPKAILGVAPNAFVEPPLPKAGAGVAPKPPNPEIRKRNYCKIKAFYMGFFNKCFWRMFLNIRSTRKRNTVQPFILADYAELNCQI